SSWPAARPPARSSPLSASVAGSSATKRRRACPGSTRPTAARWRCCSSRGTSATPNCSPRLWKEDDMDEAQARRQIIDAARSLFTRSLTHGSTGNISVRVDDRIIVTPTGSSLGTVTADDLSVISLDGAHLTGAKPSKEAFLHAAMLRARPTAAAVIHTHSTYSAAVSCLADVDPENVLPPLTAYFAMRIGRLPL